MHKCGRNPTSKAPRLFFLHKQMKERRCRRLLFCAVCLSDQDSRIGRKTETNVKIRHLVLLSPTYSGPSPRTRFILVGPTRGIRPWTGELLGILGYASPSTLNKVRLVFLGNLPAGLGTPQSVILSLCCIQVPQASNSSSLSITLT